MIDYLESALSGRDWIFIAIGVVACVQLWIITAWLSGFTKDISDHIKWRQEFDLRHEEALDELRKIHELVNSIDTTMISGKKYD